MRLLGSLIALVVGLTCAQGAAAAIDHPRRAVWPPLEIPGDASLPAPASVQPSVGERMGYVYVIDGTWEELPFTYEVLVDGRVLQEQGPGNVDYPSESPRIPFHTTIPVSGLEPGTTHDIGVRRLYPDFRRSATTTVSVKTPGTRVPDAQRPRVPKLQSYTARGAEVALKFEPRIDYIDMKVPGRELAIGMSSEGPSPITGLTPDTEYRIEVRSRDASDNTSAWVPVTFRTAKQPREPLVAPRVWVSKITPYGADVSWEPLLDAVGEPAQPWHQNDGGTIYPAIEPYIESATVPLWTNEDGTYPQPGSSHRVDLFWTDKDGRRTETKTVFFTLPLVTPMPSPPTPTLSPGDTTKPTPTKTPVPKPSPGATPKPSADPTPVASTKPQPDPASTPAMPATSLPSVPPFQAERGATSSSGTTVWPTGEDLRRASLSARTSGKAVGIRVSFAKPVSGDLITIKVALRAPDCRWWRFSQSQFVGKPRAAGSTLCRTPSSWKVVPGIWEGITANLSIPLGEKLEPGHYPVHVRFQRGRAVIAARTVTVAVR